ncbi:leucine efflux protein LeuE [Aquabacterium sp. A7-Y]|uniref:leucine efflux protein LeuE n=1 Tax=Aquabacterium sp. A7-Y TaxID=1349605 RepID=UPI00223E8A35|nr:leucine efflux protein LeuE [Aquabacterium sp. A7-Y]MCW7537945.1 leucine efflux protein LeuE [Aquabacterium sp. A7-Y]
MFYGVTDLASFVLGTIFIVLLPGPNSLYVMSVASRFGVAAGYRGACGVFLGDLVLMVLSATGAASLLQATPALFLAIKYAGAAYLAWMGVGLLRAGWAMWRGRGEAQPETPPAVDASNPFRTALLISLMNPKAILFFVSFFIQFVEPGYAHPALSFVILGSIVQFFSALYLSLLIFAGARLAQQFRRHRRLSATGTGAVGGLFLGFGAKLAGASLG